jgi:rfaE bifunctional protein nucleotidyltransferase chain/domain
MGKAKDKLLDWNSAETQAAAVQKNGGKVVFTNGCFDLVHLGHARYLADARELGDFLIVGLNSDRSVREIKGPTRPVTPQDQRAEVLAHLASVDAVVVFDEPDPHALISKVQPDILVKGGDWPLDKIIGRDVVEARGGTVKTIPLTPGVSTTDLIRRILNLNASDT